MRYKDGTLDMKLLARRPCAGECQYPPGLPPSIVTIGEIHDSAVVSPVDTLNCPLGAGVRLGQFDTGQLEVLESAFLYGGY